MMPRISVRQADFRDLTVFAAESFDFILATDNVIDALPHHDRLRALGEAYRLLRPGGILVFSCHNIRYKKAFSGPRLRWSSNPVGLAANCDGLCLEPLEPPPRGSAADDDNRVCALERSGTSVRLPALLCGTIHGVLSIGECRYDVCRSLRS